MNATAREMCQARNASRGVQHGADFKFTIVIVIALRSTMRVKSPRGQRKSLPISSQLARLIALRNASASALAWVLRHGFPEPVTICETAAVQGALLMITIELLESRRMLSSSIPRLDPHFGVGGVVTSAVPSGDVRKCCASRTERYWLPDMPRGRTDCHRHSLALSAERSAGSYVRR